MRRIVVLTPVFLGVILLVGQADSQTSIKPQPKAIPKAPPKAQPKLEPIAETQLIMEGMADTNFRGLERILQQKPNEVKAWTFARGQALLIAESANLLILRPPKSSGQSVWFDRAVELRTSAQQLARTISSQDYDQSKAGLVSLAGTCNRCHQSFRVDVKIIPFGEKLDAMVPHP
jgi:hypothetical protein